MKKFRFKNLTQEGVEMVIETYGFHFAIVTLSMIVSDIEEWEIV